MERAILHCDMNNFYASVECRERGLDPITTNLVVADSSRTEKTICLAVSPSLKAYGIPGRARLFEVIQKLAISVDPSHEIGFIAFSSEFFGDFKEKAQKIINTLY